MKKLMIFGDSIIKGVTYSGQSYHLCQDHDFDTIAAQGVTVENYARMGATIDAGLKQIDRRLAPCAEDTTVLFCFGGNDCDYDWKAISADPDGEHLPHTPSERFIDGYCTAIRKARQAGARVAMTSLPPLEQSRYFSFITKGSAPRTSSAGWATPTICTAGRNTTTTWSHSSAARSAAGSSTCGRNF